MAVLATAQADHYAIAVFNHLEIGDRRTGGTQESALETLRRFCLVLLGHKFERPILAQRTSHHATPRRYRNATTRRPRNQEPETRNSKPETSNQFCGASLSSRSTGRTSHRPSRLPSPLVRPAS